MPGDKFEIRKNTLAVPWQQGQLGMELILKLKALFHEQCLNIHIPCDHIALTGALVARMDLAGEGTHGLGRHSFVGLFYSQMFLSTSVITLRLTLTMATLVCFLTWDGCCWGRDARPRTPKFCRTALLTITIRLLQLCKIHIETLAHLAIFRYIYRHKHVLIFHSKLLTDTVKPNEKIPMKISNLDKRAKV